MELRLERGPRQRHVADRIQNLMADELIGETLTFLVDHAIIVQRQRVLQRRAMRQIHPAQSFQVFQEAEGAGRRDGLAEIPGGKNEAEFLASDRGAWIIEYEIVPGLVGGLERGGSIAVLHLDPFSQRKNAALLALPPQTGLLDQKKIRERVAIQDGGLRPIQTHIYVVQAGAGDGRHQVLDHAHPDAVFFDHCAQPGLRHQVITSGDFGAVPPEYHPLSRWRRGENHGYRGPRMQRGSRDLHLARNCISLRHGRLIAGLFRILIAERRLSGVYCCPERSIRWDCVSRRYCFLWGFFWGARRRGPSTLPSCPTASAPMGASPLTFF